MNIKIALFGVILCLVIVNGRHYGERSRVEISTDDSEDQIDNSRRNRQHSEYQMRHRRKRWQANYGYNYPPPTNPYYPDERRDYNRQQDLLPHVLRLLDEISDYVKRPPPPPPQPIYVPYPVPYPVPQYCSCSSVTPSKQPNITDRFPEMDDANQNWGFVDSDDQGQDDDSSDGIRPISFTPIRPKRPTSRPPPKVEHGSSQAASAETTQRPSSAKEGRIPSLARGPGTCDAAVLSCCRPSENRQQQRKCFIDLGCGGTFANGEACRPESIAAVLDTFSQAYSPVN